LQQYRCLFNQSSSNGSTIGDDAVGDDTMG